MRQFKTKAVAIEAEQLTDDNVEELARLCGGVIVEEIHPRHPDRKYRGINVPTAQSGNVRLSQGQWLVRDAFGRFGVLSDREFNQDFEDVEKPPASQEPMDARKGKQI